MAKETHVDTQNGLGINGKTCTITHGACTIDATGTEGLFAGDSRLTMVAGLQCGGRCRL